MKDMTCGLQRARVLKGATRLPVAAGPELSWKLAPPALADFMSVAYAIKPIFL
jgi:hypothetical protein